MIESMLVRVNNTSNTDQGVVSLILIMVGHEGSSNGNMISNAT